ncbi:protein ALTERED PHOSPHATE STARVATION RESPONSE 1-like isoform X1 [Typha angustifolia]|uniref:protein ALTERED PHOSPHATE STARVATION RESPONSE 1-like isoform X1 n=1 Tax=Typha angustifolia TaxID=59011 RepID=UPI003C2AFDB0
MGCGSSRVEESKIVSLCRDRTELIRKAADRRYALAAAHDAYFQSLAAVGDALHRFLVEELVEDPDSPAPGSPVLTLPSEGKGKSKSKGSSGSLSSSVTPLSHSLSGEGSHLHLSSGSEASPKEAIGAKIGEGEGKTSSSSPSRAASAVSSPKNYFMRSSSAIPGMVYNDSNYPYNGYDYSYGYGNPGYDNPYYFDRPAMSPPPTAPATPPPPPPPEGSTWDFFDPFISYEQYTPNYSHGRYGMDSYFGSPNSSEVREREGIPDLEDETEVEVVKEVETKGKKVAEGGGSGEMGSSVASSKAKGVQEVRGMEDKGSKSSSIATTVRSKGSDEGSSGKKKGVTFGEDNSLVEESGPSGGKLSSATSSTTLLSSPIGIRDVKVVVEEIKEHFNLAADCGQEVSRMLEVGKVPYGTGSRTLKDSMTLPVLLSSCLPFKCLQCRTASTSRSKGSNGYSDNQTGMRSGSLSSTLDKLSVWEKKLYKEVKDEEKVRVMYEKKNKRLKSLDERGAEFPKIDSTRTTIKKLRAKIDIIIKSVDTISGRMHKIRDEELHPQLVELIQGLIRMWKSVLDYHQKQLRAINHSKSHLLKANVGTQRKHVARATRKLEVELLNWCHCFNTWIKTQKSFIGALNGWLMKWLPEEQDETPDGVPPFSPSRFGAPAAFIISNDWSQAIKRISESKVSEAMSGFAVLVHGLRKAQEEERHLKLKADHLSNVYDRRLKSMQKEAGINGHLEVVSVNENGLHHHDNHMIALQTMKKRRDEERTKHEETVNQVHYAASNVLPTGLTPIFEELGNFYSENLKAYKELRITNQGGGS